MMFTTDFDGTGSIQSHWANGCPSCFKTDACNQQVLKQHATDVLCVPCQPSPTILCGTELTGEIMPAPHSTVQKPACQKTGDLSSNPAQSIISSFSSSGTTSS